MDASGETAGRDGPSSGIESVLIDLTDSDLGELATWKRNGALAEIVRQIRTDVEDPDRAVAGFQSSV